MADTDPGGMTDDQLRDYYSTPDQPKTVAPEPAAQTIVGSNGAPMSSVGALPQPTEDDQQAAAREARAAAGRTPRQRVTPEYQWMSTPPPPLGNPKDMDDQQLRAYYASGPQDNGVELGERLRLNRTEAYYTGSVSGASRLALLADIYKSPDTPDMTPEMKAARKEMREEYARIVSDLEAAKQMPGFGTTMEALAALGGQLEGTLIDPTSWIGWGAKGVTLIGQTMRAGVQQAGIQIATDPIVQALNIHAGVKDEYDPLQTVLSGVTGFGIGGVGHVGAHALGVGLEKLLGQHHLRSTLWDLAGMDPAFDAPRMATWSLDPANGIPAGARGEPPRMPGERGAETPTAAQEPAAARTELPPDHGFADTVADHKEQLGPEAPPEQAQHEAFQEEVGTSLEAAMRESGIPVEKLDDIQKHYDRKPGESVQQATDRALDDWIDAETRAQQAVETADPVLRHDLEQAEAPATRSLPPEGWEPHPDALAEAKRLSRGWSPRVEGQRPKSLIAFVRDNGGLLKDSPEAADLLSQDIGRQPGLLRTKEGGGRGFDEMAEKARDAGYDLGPDLDIGNGVNADRFKAMLEDDASGRQKHYPAGAETAAHAEARRYNDETINHLRNRLGVNPKGMDPRQIAWLLEGGHERTSGRLSEEGGGVSGGRGAQPGEGEGTVRLGAEPDLRGERGGERAAGGEAGPAAAAAAEAPRGERVGSPESLPEGIEVKYAFGEYVVRRVDDPKTKLGTGDTPAEAIASYERAARIAANPEPPVFSVRERADMETAALAIRSGKEMTPQVKRHADAAREDIQAETGRPATDEEAAKYLEEAARADRERAEAQAKKEDVPPLATERTAQGEQTLMPGVEPVSDKARAEAQMAKSLRGGDAPPPAGGLFDEDARAQGDLLGRETPEDEQGIAQRRKGGLMEDEPVRQPVEQTELRSPEEEATIKSLQQQSTELGEALDFPLRQGRLASRKHAGQFSPRTGVVRVREVPDFDVVSHEAGHALESKIGIELTTLTQQHSTELRAMDYDQGKTGRRVNEGFAEYLRLYLTNPEAARRRAPTFDLEFRAFMQQDHPDLLAKLDKAQAAYLAYEKATSVDAVGSVVRSVDEDPSFVERTAEALTKDELPNTVKSVFSKIYDTMWDDKAPMTRFVREMGKAISHQEGMPLDLKAADNPDILFRLAERSRQAATLNLQYGVRGYHQTWADGPALIDAVSFALGEQSVWGKYNEGRRKDFSAYLVARRADHLWDRKNAGLLDNPPVAFSQADAKQAMADLERLYPNFRKASGMVHDYTRQILKKAYDGHLLTTDMFEKLMKEEFYVPFMRDMKDKPVIGSGMGKGAEGPGTTGIVKKIRGSARDIIDPLESIMGQTFLIERTLAHNDIVLAMARLADRAGPAGGKYVEKIPAHELKMYVADLEQAIENRAKDIGMDIDEARQLIASLGGLDGDAIKGNYFVMERAASHGEPIMFYREGGELKAVRMISKEEGAPLYELLTAAPPVVTDIWANIMAGAGALKRSSIITNPTFMVSNYIRDQMAAALLRPDYIPFVGGIKGMADEWRQSNNAILYAYAGGVAGGRAVGVVDKAVERDINALNRKGYSLTRVPTIKELMELSSFTEAGTRNSIFGTVYEASIRKGLSPYEAMVEAAFQAQDMLDFSRHGSATLWLRKFLPFFNAHLQGLDKARRTMIEPIINTLRGGNVFERDSAAFNNALLTWGKVGAAGGALGAIYAAVMSENEAYKDASPMLKGTHLVVPFGNKVFLVPKPFELGLGFTMGEYGFHMLAQKDPRAMRMLREAAWSVLAPPDPIADMPIVTPALELGLGKSWFTGRDIVPQEQQVKPAAQQYTDRTSSLAKTIGQSGVAKFLTNSTLFKWLGDETGISPIKIDYAIGSQFATWGRDVMALSQGVDENRPAASLDDMLFFRRFVKDPNRSSDATVKFWEYMARTTGKFNKDAAGYDDLVRDAVTRGQPMTEAADFLSKLPAAEKAFVTLKSAAKDNGKPAFDADERRLHPMQHAYDAVQVINTLRKELSENRQMTYGSRERLQLNPEERRLLLENVRELGQMEIRNSLVIMGEGGYAGRPMLNPNDTMDKIRHLSPAVADEIATRYATAKIYSTATIQKSWTKLRDELVRNGSQADIRGLSFDAKAEGYQFGGARAKRPGIIRQPIPAQP